MNIYKDHKAPDTGDWCRMSFGSTQKEIGEACPLCEHPDAIKAPTPIQPLEEPSPPIFGTPLLQTWNLVFGLAADDDADPRVVPAGQRIHALDEPVDMPTLLLGDPRIGGLAIGGSRAELLAYLRAATAAVEGLPVEDPVDDGEELFIVQDGIGGIFAFRCEDQADEYRRRHPGVTVDPVTVTDRGRAELLLNAVGV